MKKLIFGFVLLFFMQAAQAQEMIEISVEITEINENKTLELGLELPSEISAVEANIPSLIESGSWERISNFTANLKALQTNGAAKILSNPKLITQSGTTAKFIVGGEFPIVADSMTAAKIDWKEYGIIMQITPTVAAGDIITIKLDTELSRLDFNVPVAGYPSVAKRKASSQLKIKNGSTMVLAGLIETTQGKTKKGVPFLSDIPILGLLFSTTKKTEMKTNVLIFVTPKIVQIR
ncbi:MAG: type II and III secretion system protein [Elusimicrobiota bacterium]|jgi:type II secretory pathway component GspD/PulD (secretin)|nr:type II and III secretion system protein [Elusimicrobiota bacterium]